jgi:uncharacterized protein (DUF1501 family)
VANVNRLLSRRSFLSRGATLVAAGWAVPSFIAETARLLDAGPDASVMAVPTAHAASNKILVIIQLAGGNDGLNMVIPYADPAYAAARPNIAIPTAQVLQLNSSVGLHPNFTRVKSRFDRGQVAVVQGVSYPNPNRSHFRGTDIWESAVPDRLEAKGWVGRYLENCGCQRSDHLEAMTVGSSQTAGTFWTEMALVPAVASISSFRYTGINNGNTTQRNSEIQTLRDGLAQAEGTAEGEFLRQSILTALTDADILAAAAGSYTPRGSYPNNGFGNAMKLVAQMIGANVGTQIYYVSLGGFDTHSGQVAAQASLFATLDQSIEGFLTDMDGISRTSDVTLMTFSEFGRRVAQNGSAGTDHGVAAPMFVIGGGLTGGLYGTYPSLTDLTSGDLKMKVDFRQVYGTVLQGWLGMSQSTVLGSDFGTLPIFSGSSPTPTPNPQPGPTCGPPRSPVHVQASPTGDGRLSVTVAAGVGNLQEIRFGAAQNAIVDVPGGQSGPGNFSIRPTGTAQTSFFVRKQGGGAATVPIVVVDDCGEWPTFVGGGASAF